MRTRPYRLAVVAFDEMDLLDVAGPLEVFSSAGRKWNWRAIKAELVSSAAACHATRAQLQVGPAAALSSCPDPELVLIPGGYGARLALEDQALLQYLRAVAPGVTLTLAIGLGTLVAARAGLLQGAEVATTPALKEELTALDGSITPRLEARAIASPRAITAAQNGAAIELGLEVVARLLGKKQASGTAQELGYAWGTETLAVEIKL
jgi:transcriptional regulator GlxA family with amidase domain